MPLLDPSHVTWVHPTSFAGTACEDTPMETTVADNVDRKKRCDGNYARGHHDKAGTKTRLLPLPQREGEKLESSISHRLLEFQHELIHGGRVLEHDVRAGILGVPQELCIGNELEPRRLDLRP